MALFEIFYQKYSAELVGKLDLLVRWRGRNMVAPVAGATWMAITKHHPYLEWCKYCTHLRLWVEERPWHGGASSYGKGGGLNGWEAKAFDEIVAIFHTVSFHLGKLWATRSLSIPTGERGHSVSFPPNASLSYYSNDSCSAAARQQVRKRFNGLDKAVRYGDRFSSIWGSRFDVY